MKNKIISLIMLLLSIFYSAQHLKLSTLLKDDISIRALEIWDGKIWYAGTDSKMGFVEVLNPKNQKQIKLSAEKLQFRTLAQNKNYFYAINIESPAYFFEINKKTLQVEIIYKDSLKSAFYDALHFHEGNFYAFSDPAEDLTLSFAKFYRYNGKTHLKNWPTFKLNKGEAAFAASNSNIAGFHNWLWVATGGVHSRILKFNLKSRAIQAIDLPFVQGSASQGIYAIDFYKDRFGVAVGGDYTQQAENKNNIATTTDGGETWQIQASEKNAGYMTCVKIRPGSKGREIIAVGDQHISYSKDFGRTWQKISDEKGFYVCEWLDKNRIVFAGKNKISMGNIFAIFGK